ncbi:MAG: CRISPR-associated endonuclease Cas3'', partial [Leptospiraceae bacterium]|nr:CRISPR-associated endonuclease Cas3'' [Leptospiraceae bacterium]
DGVAWHLLAYHSLDVAAVGWRWFEADPALRQRLCRLLGFARCEQKTAKNLIAFLLAMHDLGKFADAFQGLQNGIRQTLGKTGNPPQYQTRHDSLGYELWRHKFVRQINFGKWGGLAYDEDWFQLKTRDIPQELIELLLASAFGHHGFPPKIENTCRNHFTQSDIEAAQEFCREVYGLFNPHFPEAFDESKIHVATIWLAGFFTICDWIGSNSAIFIYQNKAQYDLKDYFEKIALERAEQALKESGLLYATPKAFSTAKELFSYLKDLTPLQKICAEIGIQNQEPALYILEDVTGSGKTEAAMILVQRLMEAHGLAGFYLGLPTMATANGMYQRMSCYYRKMYEENSHPSLVLAHGQRQLNDGFHESILAFSARDRSYAAGEETASALCASWLSDDARKSLLGHCGIGTVDQSLLAILTSRFHTVRLFGLLQKVLVLDEVHAYDAYTNQLICNLLEAQARAGLPVVLLSATLPQKLRKQFA